MKFYPATSFPRFAGFLLFAFAVCFAPLARAQWLSTTYTLRGGWNAVFLHGDATHATLDQLFASQPQVLSVWRWNPAPNQIQFASSSLIPVSGTPEWSTWTRGASGNTLTALSGQTAYLVECSGASTTTYSVPIVQKALPPRSTWVRNGANLLGFPTRLATTYPTLGSYFATFPLAIAPSTKIFKYVGGPLGPANPIQVFSTTSERLDRDQAYWFEAAAVSSFTGPLEITPSVPEGLIFGRAVSTLTVSVRNLTSASVTLSLSRTASATAPAGQDAITGQVPLTYRTFNTTTSAYEYTPVTAGSIPVVIAPQASVELTFGVDRAQITGAANALYASLLRLTDSTNAMDVYLPVSARVASLAGLWIGDVAVTNVSSRTLARLHTCQVTRTVGSVVTTVLSRAVQSGATTLGPATLPTGTGGTLSYQWKKNDQNISGATSASLTLTSTEMTESGAFGSTVPRSFPLRVLLHVDSSGTARVLQQVFMGQLATAPNDLGLCTLETGLKTDAKASAVRLSAAHLPPDAILATGSGAVALGQTLVRSFTLDHTAATNPYVHTYHPDHDNRNARFESTPLAAGVESPTITRSLSFTFAATPPAGVSAVGWGSTVLGGDYAETVTGLHRQPITVLGTFLLNRVSELGSLTTN